MMPSFALVNAAELLVTPLPASAAALAAADDRLLVEALTARGAHVQRVAWSDPGVHWTSFDRVVVRAVWDYLDDLAAFEAWLALPALQTRLVNPSPLLHWNLDKRYLLTLARAGLPVVPTRYRPAGDGADLGALCAEAGWDEAVIKPAVSASGMDTYRLRPAVEGVPPALTALASVRALLVQPFLPAVLEQGEVSIMVIDGRVTHAVCKRARPGEFRVQSNHGGTLAPYTPSAAECRFARDVVAHCPQRPSYARVDFVSTEEGPQLMELELLEPDLFLRLDPVAAGRFADALLAPFDLAPSSGSNNAETIGAVDGAAADAS